MGKKHVMGFFQPYIGTWPWNINSTPKPLSLKTCIYAILLSLSWSFKILAKYQDFLDTMSIFGEASLRNYRQNSSLTNFLWHNMQLRFDNLPFLDLKEWTNQMAHAKNWTLNFCQHWLHEFCHHLWRMEVEKKGSGYLTRVPGTASSQHIQQ